MTAGVHFVIKIQIKFELPLQEKHEEGNPELKTFKIIRIVNLNSFFIKFCFRPRNNVQLWN